MLVRIELAPYAITHTQFHFVLSLSRWHARYTITESTIASKNVRCCDSTCLEWNDRRNLSVLITTRQARLCLCETKHRRENRRRYSRVIIDVCFDRRDDDEEVKRQLARWQRWLAQRSFKLEHATLPPKRREEEEEEMIDLISISDSSSNKSVDAEEVQYWLRKRTRLNSILANGEQQGVISGDQTLLAECVTENNRPRRSKDE